jgi:hypothetical protein
LENSAKITYFFSSFVCKSIFIHLKFRKQEKISWKTF